MDPQGVLFNQRTETSSALFSPCRQYRYKLSRVWDEALPKLNFLMLNPSTADETVNDPTISRQIERAKRWGYGSLHITNLFAWRSTDPKFLRDTPDPVGLENDWYIRETATICDLVVCGWGNNGTLKGRYVEVLKLLANIPLKALRVTKTGQPEHPLYIGYDVSLKDFNA